MLSEFRNFAMRGNVVDMAVGIVIGVAFGAIINSFVDDLLMPPIGLLFGNMDFSNLFVVLREGSQPGPYLSLEAGKAAGAVLLRYGLFINTLISFVLVAFALFFVIRAMNRLRKSEAPAAPSIKSCPKCVMSIPIAALRCPHCTSDLQKT